MELRNNLAPNQTMAVWIDCFVSDHFYTFVSNITATWCLFLDLMKAYNTIQHKLLFTILGILGIPSNIHRIIQALYTDITL